MSRLSMCCSRKRRFWMASCHWPFFELPPHRPSKLFHRQPLCTHSASFRLLFSTSEVSFMNPSVRWWEKQKTLPVRSSQRPHQTHTLDLLSLPVSKPGRWLCPKGDTRSSISYSQEFNGECAKTGEGSVSQWAFRAQTEQLQYQLKYFLKHPRAPIFTCKVSSNKP